MKTFRSISTQEGAWHSVSAVRCDFCAVSTTQSRSHDSPFGVSKRFSNSAASACQRKAALHRHAPHTWRFMRLSLSTRERFTQVVSFRSCPREALVPLVPLYYSSQRTHMKAYPGRPGRTGAPYPCGRACVACHARKSSSFCFYFSPDNKNTPPRRTKHIQVHYEFLKAIRTLKHERYKKCGDERHGGARAWPPTLCDTKKSFVTLCCTSCKPKRTTPHLPLLNLLNGEPPLPDKLVCDITLCVIASQLVFQSNKALLLVLLRASCAEFRPRVPVPGTELPVILLQVPNHTVVTISKPGRIHALQNLRVFLGVVTACAGSCSGACVRSLDRSQYSEHPLSFPVLDLAHLENGKAMRFTRGELSILTRSVTGKRIA